MNKISSLLLVIGVILFTVRCSEKEDDPFKEVDRGENYYPVDDSLILTYRVKSINFFNTGKETENYYEQKRYSELSNGVNFRVDIYKSLDTMKSWNYSASYLLNKNDSIVLINVDNYRTKLLEFPVKDGRVWDGNSYNVSDYQGYTCKELGSVFTNINGDVYDNTVKVNKGELLTLISHDQELDVYAYNKGLVYSLVKHIGFQPGADTTGIIFEKSLMQ